MAFHKIGDASRIATVEINDNQKIAEHRPLTAEETEQKLAELDELRKDLISRFPGSFKTT